MSSLVTLFSFGDFSRQLWAARTALSRDKGTPSKNFAESLCRHPLSYFCKLIFVSQGCHRLPDIIKTKSGGESGCSGASRKYSTRGLWSADGALQATRKPRLEAPLAHIFKVLVSNEYYCAGGMRLDKGNGQSRHWGLQ